MPALRVIRTALEADGRAWAAALADGQWRQKARVLKRDGGTVVYRTRLLDREVVVKCWDMTTKSRVQSLLGNTRGLRHWRGAARLRKCGVATAWTWALLRGDDEGRRVESLVMEALSGRSLLQHMADRDLTVPEEHAVTAAVARDVARLLHRGLYNRDHKPSNLIVVDPARSAAKVAVVDCLAISTVGLLKGQEPGLQMFTSLMLEPIGVGHPPRRTLILRFLTVLLEELELLKFGPSLELSSRSARRDRRRAIPGLIRQVEARIRDHGDPTPRVNPLSPS